LKAAAAPDTMAMPRLATSMRAKSGSPVVASIMPTQAVSTSSATTRGLVSCQNARPSASASPRLPAAVGIRL
jgi:hypothetical protein